MRFFLSGLLTVSLGKETASNVAEKPLTAKAEDVVLLEIDVKEPSKRSPLTASGVYGASPNQYIIRHGDDVQEVRIIDLRINLIIITIIIPLLYY